MSNPRNQINPQYTLIPQDPDEKLITDNDNDEYYDPENDDNNNEEPLNENYSILDDLNNGDDDDKQEEYFDCEEDYFDIGNKQMEKDLIELRVLPSKCDDSQTANTPEEPKSLWGYTKDFAVRAGAAAVSAPTAMFALGMVSRWPMIKIGQNVTGWWKSMTPFQQGYSIANGLSAEWVNYKLNVDFFKQFWGKLKDSFKEEKNAKFFLKLLAYVVMGGAGGVTAGALAFKAFEFSLGIGITFAIGSFSVYFIGRYLGAFKFLNRFLNRKNLQTQRDVIDKFDHLKSNYKLDLENHLKDVVKALQVQSVQLDEKKLEDIFKSLAEKLQEIKNLHPDCFNEITRREQAAALAGTIFDTTLATFIFSISLISFSKVTRVGVEALDEFTTKKLKNITNAERIPLGILGGFASSVLYGISAYEFRRLLVDACYYLYQHPSEIPNFLKELTFNILAISGMANVGRGIPGPDNEFGIPLNDATSWLFIIGCATGALAVNFSPTLKTFTEKPDLNNPKLDQVINYFRNPSVHLISNESAKSLRQHSLFQPSPKDRDNRLNEVITAEPVAERPRRVANK